MTSSCLHLHRPKLFDCFENFAIRKRECYFCFASISANRQMLINKPTKQISALVRKEYGRNKERSVGRILRKPCHNPFKRTSGVY